MEKDNVLFGQIVVGPPGAGKTTYCAAICEYLIKLGRKAFVINLDPGNDISLPYTPQINITELISVEETMKQQKLGPNGALIYCMEYLATNVDWLIEKIEKLCLSDNTHLRSRPYLIIDSPGQVELYVHNSALKKVIQSITKLSVSGFDLRLAAVNLVDSFYANDPGKFIAALLNSLATMLNLELPHINVLSKIDLIEKFGPVHYNIDYYCEVMDLNYIIDHIIDHPFMLKFKKLTEAIAGVVESYGLVTFVPLDINNLKTMTDVIKHVDKANGYFLSDIESNEQLQRVYEDTQKAHMEYEKYAEIREKLLSGNKPSTTIDEKIS